MRKHVIRVLIASLLIGSCLNVTAYAEGATVTGSQVNVRSGPGVSYDVLGSVSRGTILEVTDRSNSDWYAISYGGRVGYISASYVTLEDVSYPAAVVPDGSASAPGGGSTVSGSSGTINGSYVRFRKGPSSSSEILGEYSQGKALTILGTSGDWTACVIDGQEGFVYSQFVSVDSAAEASPATVIQTPEPAATPTPNGNGILIRDSASTQAGNAGTVSGGSGVIVQFQPPASGTAAPVATVAPVIQATPVPQAQTPTQTQAAGSPAAGGEGNVTSYAQAQTGTIIADRVRFRKGPGATYSILSSYDKGKSISVLGTAGEWTYCSIDGQNGYVFSQYVQVGAGEAAQPVTGSPSVPVQQPGQTGGAVQPVITDSAGTGGNTASGTQGFIKGNNVRLRAMPDSSSQILAELFYGSAVTITGSSGDWTAVNYEGRSGFVFSQYVATGVYQNVSVGGTTTGREIADFALQYVGTPYHWGGNDPSTGFDCSGFMYYVYKNFGYTLNRVASEQALNGKHVEASDLQPGDLLCFYSGGSYIGHVGMYIGNNMFVHAATSTTGVITSELAGYYARRGFEARRII